MAKLTYLIDGRERVELDTEDVDLAKLLLETQERKEVIAEFRKSLGAKLAIAVVFCALEQMGKR
jgi:hypothetical protein